MGEGREGLSLQGLAERLEALERENETMRRENAELRGEVATFKGAATRGNELPASKAPKEPVRSLAKRSASGAAEETVSRRAMLTKAGAAAVAAVAAGTMLSPREAKAATVAGAGDPGVAGVGVDDGSTGVVGQLGGGVAFGDGVQGYGKGKYYNGVIGLSFSSRGYGVSGHGGTGVQGVSYGAGPGVYGRHSSKTEGHGVKGEGKGSGRAGVLGTNADGGGYGVWGLNTSSGGTGVYGYGYCGVRGQGRGSGYGGQFEGGKAQLKLTPKGTQGRPKSGQHQKGEIYVDSATHIFVCTGGGTPGTWRKVTTTSA